MSNIINLSKNNSNVKKQEKLKFGKSAISNDSSPEEIKLPPHQFKIQQKIYPIAHQKK